MIISTGLADALAGAMPGQSLRKIFEYAVLGIYGGAIPADADLAETGTLIGWLTVDSLPFVPGSPTNGLVWGPPAGGICPKSSSEIWSFVPLVTMEITWARLYTNTVVTGYSTVEKRIDYLCGAASGDLQFSVLLATQGQVRTIDLFDLGFSRFI